MKIIKKLKLVIATILLINCLFINCCFAAVAVTKENLNTSLQGFISSDENTNNYKAAISDKVITITTNGKNYTLNYDLTNKPTFSFEIPIQKGMSYADFKDQTDNIVLPMLGYIVTANVQGVDYKTANDYFLMSYLNNGFGGSWSSDSAYTIYDDTNLSNGVTVDKNNSDPKTIYASEFGDKAIEYVNATYKDKQTITDETSGINSYEWSVERKDVTDTSCKLVSSLSVNTNADFTQLNGSNKNNDTTNKDFPKNNSVSSVVKQEQLPQNNQYQEKSSNKDVTVAKGELPKTGANNIIYILMIVSTISLVAVGIKLRKYKNIK